MSSCTSPLYRVPVGSLNFGLLSPFDQNKRKNGGVFLKYHDLKMYETLPNWHSDSVQILRCGQCSSCRLKSSYDWAVRCSLEAAEHEFNYFITLTYDDFHLPQGEFVDYMGQVWNSTLDIKHVQLFVKNLREYERDKFGNDGIKVFYCGEYGDLNGRPHYHLCLFGVSEIPDLSLHRVSGGFKFYKSVLYESFWQDKKLGLGIPRGFVDISELSFDTIAYTARYVMKKQKGLMAKEFLTYYETLDDPPALRKQPFISMSRRPGLAHAYYERNKQQILLEDSVKYQRKYKLFSSKTPRYFSKLLESDYPGEYNVIKSRRARSSIAARNTKLSLISETEFSRYSTEASIINSKEKRFRVRSI